MPHGGALSVRTWTEGGFAHVEVADTGHGISTDHLARIYDPFFTTKGARKGTGLGLSITYGIVQEHNGLIEVESKPDEGTRLPSGVSGVSRKRSEVPHSTRNRHRLNRSERAATATLPLWYKGL